MATRWRSPPLRAAGAWSARWAEPDRVEHLARPRLPARLPSPVRVRGQGHVLGGGEGVEQSEVLEDEPDRFAPEVGQLVATELGRSCAAHLDVAALGAPPARRAPTAASTFRPPRRR